MPEEIETMTKPTGYVAWQKKIWSIFWWSPLHWKIKETEKSWNHGEILIKKKQTVDILFNEKRYDKTGGMIKAL